jgi:hypothetical protein
VSSEAVPSSTRGLIPTHDRRHRNRLVIPPCDQCASPETAVATRTTLVLYIRCGACSNVWSVPKPRYERVGAGS